MGKGQGGVPDALHSTMIMEDAMEAGGWQGADANREPENLAVTQSFVKWLLCAFPYSRHCQHKDWPDRFFALRAFRVQCQR